MHGYHSSSSLASLIKEFVGFHLNGCGGDGVGVGLEDGVCDLWILFLQDFELPLYLVSGVVHFGRD